MARSIGGYIFHGSLVGTREKSSRFFVYPCRTPLLVIQVSQSTTPAQRKENDVAEKWKFEMLPDNEGGAKRAIVTVNGSDHVITSKFAGSMHFRPYLGSPGAIQGEEFNAFLRAQTEMFASDLPRR